MEKTQQCQETLPSHISKIGLCTGHMYFIGAIVAYLNNFPNLIVVCSCVYVTTMVHWRNMKSTGVAKTVDMITVVAGISFITFHESYKFADNCREIWNSTMIICITSYLFNTVVVIFQSEEQEQEQIETPYNYFALCHIPKNSPNREKMHFYTTIVHTFFLHILPILVGSYCVIKT